ncbi:MAG: hypothetical protein KGD64_03965 [Candidatus Heimdallarchaeota archaeon]|nr:hypothetical protein [Candidatus Heimdallarchaeota archaeon]
MKLTTVSLPPYIEREVITCKYCNGKATKNGKLSDRLIYKNEKIKSVDKKRPE